MGNHASLSKNQAVALGRYLERTLPESADALIKDVGVEDAFTLLRLKERLKEKDES